jgi:hypothetical protein
LDPPASANVARDQFECELAVRSAARTFVRNPGSKLEWFDYGAARGFNGRCLEARGWSWRPIGGAPS